LQRGDQSGVGAGAGLSDLSWGKFSWRVAECERGEGATELAGDDAAGEWRVKTEHDQEHE
jgi:hypothetical protein